jgi:hypothetical protein
MSKSQPDFLNESLKYKGDPPDPNRASELGLMFRYMTPLVFFAMGWLTSWYIETSHPNGDSRNIGSACAVFLSAPGILIFLYPLVRESFRFRGGITFLNSAAWWAMINLVVLFVLWLNEHCRVLRHRW